MDDDLNFSGDEVSQVLPGLDAWDQMATEDRLEAVQDFADALVPDGEDVSVDVGHLTDGQLVVFDEVAHTITVDQDAMDDALSVQEVVAKMYDELQPSSTIEDQFNRYAAPNDEVDAEEGFVEEVSDSTVPIGSSIGCLGICNIKCLRTEIVGIGKDLHKP